MPKPVLYPKLWIKNHDDQEWSVFTDVTGYEEGAEWYEYEGVFRNKAGAGVGKLQAGLGSGSVPAVTDVPVVGTNTAPGVTSAAVFPALRMVTDDEALGVPHRFKRVRHTGIVIAVGEAELPVAEAALGRVTNFTAATTGVCTSGSGGTVTTHSFSLGDLVAAYNTGGALPGGLNNTEVYEFIRLNSVEFRLRSLATGALIGISSAGTGVHTLLQVESRAVPASVPGVFRFSSLYRPQRSLGEPQ